MGPALFIVASLLFLGGVAPGLLIAGLISILLWVVIDCPAVGVLALTKMGDASSVAQGPPPAAPPGVPAPEAPPAPEGAAE